MKRFLLSCTIMTCVGSPAFAQTSPTEVPAAETAAPNQASATQDWTGINDIIVTAQKRSQSINTVGMSISATTGDVLAQKGITDTADLTKAVPGFTFTQSPYATPVYTLRGIGLYDYSLGSSPSVAVYVDEVSLPYPSMGVGATLDLERVEVLKGPQGTLFGASSTGGAVNYIAAKPTDTLQAGGSVSYERFGKLDASGYVSGPISDTLRARLAMRMVEGGAWQRSLSRPEDRNGSQRLFIGRVLLDWEPTDRLTFHLNVNGNRDGGDTQQPQLQLNQPNIVAAPDARNPNAIVDPVAFNVLTNPASLGYDPSFVGRQNTLFNRAAAGEAGTIAYLAAPTITGKNIRSAEWSPDFPTRRFDHFYQVALRGEYRLSDDITFTSVTAYAYQKVNRYFDNDGTVAQALDVNLFGSIKSFNQELRLSGDTGPLTWLVGAGYDSAKTDDTVLFNMQFVSLNEALPGLRFTRVFSNLKQDADTYSGFGHVEYKVTNELTLEGGLRYTKIERFGDQCTSGGPKGVALAKTFGNADVVPGFGFYDLQTAFGLDPAGHIVLAPGQCHALNDLVPPTDPNYLRPSVTPFRVNLPEDNVSWRLGLNYKFDQGALLYANVSTGYKSGIITGSAPSVVSQYTPATQEKVVAYEAGFKAPLFDRRVQLNGAVFYYDYSNKQVRARVRDALFGLLEKAVNVPKSRIWGIEGEFVAQPVEGLNLSLAGTYIKSKVTQPFATSSDGLPIYNQAGFTGDFQGSRLPFTPTFTGVADAEYSFPVKDSLKASFGGSVTYHSKDNATFRTPTLDASDYELKQYVLLDLRANLGAPDDSWRVSIFGRNVTNTFYVTTIFAGADPRYRYTGMPATYGVSITFKTR